MTMFRTLMAAAAALVIAMPAFADDTTSTTTTTSSDSTGATQTTTESTTTSTKVDLNKATPKELMSVKGISASKAKAIVSYRKKHGDFKSVEDLAQVKGFKNLKPEQLKDIEDQLSVE